jgi:hypothetical protein
LYEPLSSAVSTAEEFGYAFSISATNVSKNKSFFLLEL